MRSQDHGQRCLPPRRRDDAEAGIAATIEGASMSAIDTTCVQGGYQPGNGESRTPPIIQATTFKYTSSEQMSRLFDLSETGYFYTRLQNPTNDTVAAKICEMEGGAGRDADLVRPGGELLRAVQHLQRGRPHRRLLRDLRRHVQPDQRDDAQDGHRVHVREPRLHAGGAGRRVPTEYQGRVRRIDLESGADRARLRQVRLRRA